MILGVMSDTHGHITQMRGAAVRMFEEFHVELLIHLGDDSTDADELSALGYEVLFVPGIYEQRYNDPKIPKRLVKNFDGIPFLLTHTPAINPNDRPEDVDPTAMAQDGDVKVVLHGHIHKPEIYEKHGAIYINPGHLKEGMDRGSPPTFAIVETSPSKLRVRIVHLDGQILEDKMFHVGV